MLRETGQRNIEKLQQLYDVVDNLDDESFSRDITRPDNYFDYRDLNQCFIGQTILLFKSEVKGVSGKVLEAEKILGLNADEIRFLFFQKCRHSSKAQGLERLQHLIDGKAVQEYRGN